MSTPYLPTSFMFDEHRRLHDRTPATRLESNPSPAGRTAGFRIAVGRVLRNIAQRLDSAPQESPCRDLACNRSR